MKHSLSLKLKNHSEWRIPKLKNEKYQKLFQQEKLTWKELCKKIKSSESYYVSRNGLIIDDVSRAYGRTDAYYILAILDGFKTKDNKQFYAWMEKDEKGEFKNIHFGTIQEFSSIISKTISKKEKNL